MPPGDGSSGLEAVVHAHAQQVVVAADTAGGRRGGIEAEIGGGELGRAEMVLSDKPIYSQERPLPRHGSGSADLTPFGKSSGASVLKCSSAGE